MNDIPLHNTRGLDPHLTLCPRCGGAGTSLTIGEFRKAQLDNGHWVYAQRGKTTKVIKTLGLESGDLNWQEVGEYERIPDNDICPKCKEDIAIQRKEVELGGIYFRCTSCNTTGVIKQNHVMAQEVREHAGIKAPDEVGVEFNSCEQHGGKLDESA